MKMTKMTLTTLTTNQKHNYAEFLGVTEGQARCDGRKTIGDSFVLQQQRAAGRLQKYKKSSIPLQYGGLFCDKLGD